LNNHRRPNRFVKSKGLRLLLGCLLLIDGTAWAFAQDPAPADTPKAGQRRVDQPGRAGGGSGLGNYDKPPKANQIPDHPFDLILGRPTDSSIEVRILHNADGEGHIEYP
jgi:hypothetical protein